MKKAGLKRLFALALILVLAFSLSAPAFAGSEEVEVPGTPAPTDTPEVTETPTTTDTPTATETPAITDTPTVTETPAITDTPTVTETPATTDTPEVTETPTTTDTPEVTETPAPTETPAADEVPAAVKTFLDAVAAIVIPEEINEETGPVLNGQIGTAQAAYDALSEEDLAREDVQAAVALMKKAMDALTGGTQTLTAVAQIGDTPYDTLDEAIAAAITASEAGTEVTIVVLGDCDANGFNVLTGKNIKITSDANATVTLNSNVTVNGALTFNNIKLVCNHQITLNQGASLAFETVNLTMDGSSVGSNNLYYNGAIQLEKPSNLTIDNSNVRISNYYGSAVRWDATAEGYNINIQNGTNFIAEGCYAGFTGTHVINIDKSTVNVVKNRGNGANGSHFNITNSTVNFSDNGSHGLSAGWCNIVNSTVIANGNGGNGLHTNSTLTIDGSTVTIENNKCSISSQWTIPGAIHVGAGDSVIKNSTVTVQNNSGSGIYQKDAAGSLTIEDSANVTIVKNTAEKLGYGGGIYVNGTVSFPGNLVMYNNHAGTAGDDIYNAATGTITFGKVGSDWILDDCNDAIDGWYRDGYALDGETTVDTRWNAHSEPYINEYTDFTGNMTNVKGLLALKAAHGLPKNPDVQPNVPAPDWAVSKSKTATNLDENFESQVTLGLPAASYKGNLDVAFVLDGSTSADQSGLAAQAAALLDELAAIQNLNVKASLTVFGGTVPLLENTGLLNISSDAESLASLKEKLTDPSYDKKEGRSGSNFQAGVDAANQTLAGDSSVDSADKYMIILSDGGARMWYKNGAAMSQTYCPGGSIFWNSNEDFLKRYGTTGQEAGVKPLRSFAEVWEAGQSGAYIGMYGMTEAEKNAATTDQVASWNTVANEESYYTTLEAATYYAAGAIVRASQSSNVIFVSYPYHSGATYTTYAESFKTWLASEGYVTRYDKPTPTTDVSPIFAAVKDELVQVVDAGSKVVDVIGNVEGDYNFDFVNSIDKLTLTVGGTALSKTSLTASNDNETACYGFGGNDFILHYYSKGQDGQSDECFVWDINVPVTKDEPVQLTYTVKLTNPETDEGTYGQYDADGSNPNATALYTNNSATLYPVDSNGTPGYPQEFPKPTVSYTVEAAKQTVTVTKVWEDSNNADGLRPDSVTVTLLANGKETDKTLVLNAANKWTGSFENLDAKDADGKAITYTVAENKVEYYTTAITKADGTLNFTITNSHEVVRISIPVQKVWNDDNDANGKRPNSVTIYLYANGEKVDTMRLSAKSGWKGSFENLPVFKDGKSISYSISEKSMYFYDGKVTVNENRDGFVVTNTYTTSPHTGDTSNIGLWVAVAVVCLVGIGAAVVIIKKKGSKK